MEDARWRRGEGMAALKIIPGFGAGSSGIELSIQKAEVVVLAW
jgi:hypothetical protein